MTHSAEEHAGRNTADLMDTIFLHWYLSNTSAGSREDKQFKAKDRNK